MQQIAKWIHINIAKEADFHEVYECHVRELLNAKPLTTEDIRKGNLIREKQGWWQTLQNKRLDYQVNNREFWQLWVPWIKK